VEASTDQSAHDAPPHMDARLDSSRIGRPLSSVSSAQKAS
jgi:hypothetical protein